MRRQTRPSTRPGTPSTSGGGSPRPTVAASCAASPRRWTPTAKSWPAWRWSTPATPSPTPGGRRATSATCSTTTPLPPKGCSAARYPVPGGVDITFKEPLGVVGVIVPWNFPMPIAGWGFAPALAAGNTVVLKPAELTPLTALRLAELALEAGLPEHVFTVLPGQGAVVGDRFVAHPARAQGRLHGVDRGGQADNGRLCRTGEAGDTGARGQERQHRLRRRRHRAGGGHARR